MKFLLLAFSLAFSPSLFAKESVRFPENNLERSFAEGRRAQIKSLAYALSLEFKKGESEYSGKVKISVELNQVDRPLNLDWRGKAFKQILVNGEEIAELKSLGSSVEIPANLLRDKNEIEIAFTNTFGTEGAGIQRVVDPEDKLEYIYTDFEPFQAHDLFPCFDQPDLKAELSLDINAPADWIALGNELPRKIEKSGDSTRTFFKTTRAISTYLYFAGAGPFTEWTDTSGPTPIYLHARRSLAKYVDPELLFGTSKKGLAFFSEYFGYPYPFSKFGLIFAPEFGWGGMENPGAITLNERNIFRGPVPASRRDGRNGLILHEMAHMWFGDLVTMQWWNDLWLNESFASYMADVAQDRALGSRMAWQDFASTKTWGYWQDQLVTTHPIETEVKDVRTAKGNFDGITYAKGASALQQLHFYVGEEAFKTGVQAYFQKHAFGNAKRADFVNAIAAAAKLDLSGWTRAWLQTAGPNKVSAKWSCAGGKLRDLTVIQEKSSSRTLAPHRTRVGLFQNKEGVLELLESYDVSYAGAATSVRLGAEHPCPDFVYPNLDDKDYALFSIDAASLKSVPLVLGGGVKDSLLRLQVWNTLSQMVREGKLPAVRYMEMASAGLAKEDDDGVLAILLGRHSPVKDIYNEFLSIRERAEIAPGFEQVIWDRATSADKGSSRAMTFFDFSNRLVQTEKGLANIAAMLEKNSPPAGIELDHDRRWAIINTLARRGHARALELVEAELKKDPSDSAQRYAHGARVAFPKMENKRAFWNEIEHPEKISPITLRSSAGEFNQPNYPALSEAFVKEFFARVKKVDWKNSDQLVEIYFESLFAQNLCTKKLLALSQKELAVTKGLTLLARRTWMEANDELARCVRVGHR